jgi:AcrR family transcriptional regulator
MQRADILQAAAQIFSKKGYHAASMQDIAAAVHLQKASLYHHVDSKQEILLAIVDKTLDLLIEDLEDVVRRPLPPQEKLRCAIQTYVGRLTEDADLAAVLLLEYRSVEPDLRARQIERRDSFEALWRKILKEGIQEKVFRPVDESIATFALLGIQNWMITWYREAGRLSPSDLADQFFELFLNGLKNGGEAAT